MAGDEEAMALTSRALELVSHFDDGDNVEDGQEDVKLKKREAAKLLTQGTPWQALQAAMVALEAIIVVAQVKELPPRLQFREILWLSKDAAALFAESGDKHGKAIALMTVARAHLARSNELDAPVAALRIAKEVLAIASEIADRRMEADALRLVGEAHVAKATATPFENVLVEQINLAVEATKRAEQISRELGDKRGMANAMHGTAKALLRHTDEDEVLEGERFADDARELFHDLRDGAAEVAVLLTGVAARHATSGPESALMMAKDAAEDWQQEGGRHKDTALALLLAASFQLELGEYEDALKLCSDAQALNERVGNMRGVAASMETRSAILFAKKQQDEALRELDDMASIYRKLGDAKAQGIALLSAAKALLNQLSEEVDLDTKAEQEKRDVQFGISTADVQKRGADALKYASEACKCFEAAGDEEGPQLVADVIQATYDKAMETYCQVVEPDQVYYTLSKDSPFEDSSKSIREWRIPMPSLHKSKGDGYLHIFDPHPPPKL